MKYRSYGMAAVAFDTLKFANMLKSAGVDAHTAEAQAAAQGELLTEFMHEKLVTKHFFRQEMDAFRQEIHQEMDAFRQEIRQEIAAFRQEMEAFRQEIRQEMEAFRQEIRQEMEAFRQEIRREIREELDSFRHEIDKKLQAFANELRLEFRTEIAKLEARWLKAMGALIVGTAMVMTAVLSGVIFLAQR